MRHKESLALGERARRGDKSPSGHRAKKKKTQMDEWTSECSHLMDRLLEHAQWAVEHMWLYSVGLNTESEHLA